MTKNIINKPQKVVGVDLSELHHYEVAAFKASMDAIEADIFMEIAEKMEQTESVDKMIINPKLLGKSA